MVRTFGNKELCREESPRRCHECFPQISPQTFFMRKRFIQSHLALVDHFIAPSDYVRDRYVDWGIPADKISVEPQGMVPVTRPVPEEPETRPRNRFAFFGQLNPYKGADVLLRGDGASSARTSTATCGSSAPTCEIQAAGVPGADPGAAEQRQRERHVRRRLRALRAQRS